MVKNETCNDVNCPMHGTLATRGLKREGTIVSNKMKNGVIIEINSVKKNSKYKRYERRRKRIPAHNPECMNAKLGDKVLIQECQPISKTKSFVVVNKKEDKKE